MLRLNAFPTLLGLRSADAVVLTPATTGPEPTMLRLNSGVLQKPSLRKHFQKAAQSQRLNIKPEDRCSQQTTKAQCLPISGSDFKPSLNSTTHTDSLRLTAEKDVDYCTMPQHSPLTTNANEQSLGHRGLRLIPGGDLSTSWAVALVLAKRSNRIAKGTSQGPSRLMPNFDAGVCRTTNMLTRP